MFARFMLIAVGNLLRQAAAVLAQLLVARRVGDNAFGVVAFAFSIYLLMAGLADFGSRLYCWRTVAALAEEDRAAAANNLVWQRLILALTVFVLLNIAISFYPDPRTAWVLRAYSVAVAFNQVAFDWWFLSQDRVVGLSLFNIASGLLLLLGTVLMVHGPGDIAVYALILSLSCGIPGVLMTMVGRGLPPFRILRMALRLPLATRSYVGYDWLQRIYQAFLPIVGWYFYDQAAVGQFRVAYLFYWFAGTLAIYAGSAVFNRVVRVGAHADVKVLMSSTAALLLLIVLPLSAVARMLANPFVETALGPSYLPSEAHLSLLLPFLAIPVIANFLREATMASGRPVRAMWSYVATVVVASAGIALFSGFGTRVLSLATLTGEAVGILPLLFMVEGQIRQSGVLWRLPIGVLSYFLIIATARSIWVNAPLLTPYGVLMLNGAIGTIFTAAIVGGTLLIERQCRGDGSSGAAGGA